MYPRKLKASGDRTLTKSAETLTKIRFCYLKATGPRLGGIASSLITAVGCLVLAFVSGWKLALVVLAFLPFIIIGGMMEMQIYFGNTLGGDTINSEEAGKVRAFCSVRLYAIQLPSYITTVEGMYKPVSSIYISGVRTSVIRPMRKLRKVKPIKMAELTCNIYEGRKQVLYHIPANSKLFSNGPYPYNQVFSLKYYSLIIFLAPLCPTAQH